MSHYYFLGTLLPELHIDKVPEMGFRELSQYLSENLSENDYGQIVTIRNYYDIFNVRAWLKGEPLDPHGNLDEGAMEEAMTTETVLPQYVFHYLEKYDNKEDRVLHFPELLATYFKKEIERTTGTIKSWLQLEREMRLIMTAFRSKKLGRNLYTELQYENPEDEIVAQILAQKDAQQYEPPDKYFDLRSILHRCQDDPFALQKELYEYRFRKLAHEIGIDFFSLDRILAYFIELIMIEKWQGLDRNKGNEILHSILKEPS